MTPRVSPNAEEEEESKGLSQKDIGKKENKEDEKMWDDMFMNGENYDEKNGWKKWKDQFGDDEAEEGRKPRIAQRIPKVSNEDRGPRVHSLPNENLVQILRGRPMS